ncbi:hypothetical protein F2P81_024889 [Scophthalmus maximus]|uniref:Uncharacterized protein n=1 Tax=Scophthalmus maximus TaxID=52904 RepID=A0A6A4RS85_SCOMX|nr:hypothetical protein F2P81_024889 [Scophthalmus maximus]
MTRRLSSLEFLLCVVSSLLLICCVGLIVVSWFSLRPEGAVEPAVLTGRMVITEGAQFSEELKNSSSRLFKSLAFDVQQLVSEAFGLTELRRLYRSCQVLDFSQGSVAVTFDLWFYQLIGVKDAELQLRAGLKEAEGRGLLIDSNSIQITEKPDVTTAAPTSVTSSTVTCRPHHKPCADRSMCILINRFCDGVNDCSDASDEDGDRCATACDGQFVLRGPSGSFSSSDVSDTYKNNSVCRWIIRVDQGFSVRVDFHKFVTEENIDTVKLYAGVGPHKQLTAELSGSAPPGTVWLLTDQSTVEFISDDVNNLSGFNATYSTANLSDLSNEKKLTCTFEQGMCFWRQQQDDDDGDWIRTSGSTFPLLTGPSADHTLGNSSGGSDVEDAMMVLLLRSSPSQPEPAVTVVFQRDGNYGDNWNYGQATLNLTDEATVTFEALKKGGMRNDISLDDIFLTPNPCGPSPPEPTNVPPPMTTPPIPADCGGPFDLWEPNSTFSSPNYPHSYGNKAKCLWTLHTVQGQNIQLHFLDFNIEATYDVVEVRDGAGPNSTLLAVLTGDDGPAHDLFSTTNQMTVWFFTDSSGHSRGFRANFTSGVDLGSPAPCAAGQFQCRTGSCIHGNSQCDAVVDCPDASDEADCGNSHPSHLTCQYLGYRSGEASLIPALPQDSPFSIITVTSNGTMEATVSETCSSEKVIDLNCDNQLMMDNNNDLLILVLQSFNMSGEQQCSGAAGKPREKEEEKKKKKKEVEEEDFYDCQETLEPPDPREEEEEEEEEEPENCHQITERLTVRGDITETDTGGGHRQDEQGDRLHGDGLQGKQGDRLQEKQGNGLQDDRLQDDGLQDDGLQEEQDDRLQGDGLQEEQGDGLQGDRLQDDGLQDNGPQEEQDDRLQDDGLQECDSDSEMKEEQSQMEFDDEYLREAEKELTEEEKEGRRQQSLSLKEKGNREFKDGAIELNPDYVRALLRRAELYEQTEKLDEALEDYKMVLERDPNQTSARLACMKLPQQIQERNEKLKEEMLGNRQDLGNMILRPFGLSTNNFQVNQDQGSGSYSINFVQKPSDNR